MIFRRYPGVILRESLSLGLTTALIFFVFEFILVSLAGSHIAVEYQLLALGFYLFAGAGMGAVVGACFELLVGRSQRISRYDAAILIKLIHIFGFVFLFALHLIFHHPSLTSRIAPIQRYLAGFTIIFGGVIVIFAAWKIASKRPQLVSYSVGIVLLSFFASGGLYMNEEFFPDAFHVWSVLGNLMFIAVLGGLYFLGCGRVLNRVGYDVRGETRAVLYVAGAGLVGLALITAHPFERSRFEVSSKSQVNEASRERPNVILISLDALRRDHLSMYGYHRNTSPHIDSFGADSEVYDNAISNSSWTLPSHGSVFTGFYPVHHGAHRVDRDTHTPTVDDALEAMGGTHAAPLRDRFVTLPELLKRNGYTTGGIVGNSAYLCEGFGIGQGFDYYDDMEGMFLHFRPVFETYRRRLLGSFLSHRFKPYRPAEEISDAAFEWVEANRDTRFFLFANYMDPHAPYLPPPPYNSLFSGRLPARKIRVDKDEIIRAFQEMRRSWATKSVSHKEEREFLSQYDKVMKHYVSQYDGEIRYLDYHLGRFFEKLKQLGLYDDSLIVLFSDHGEAFGENFLLGHGTGLLEAQIKIPLIIKYPNSRRVGRVENPGQLVDIFPTVLKEIKLDAPDEIDGQLLGPGNRRAPVLSELYLSRERTKKVGFGSEGMLRAVYFGRYKYIWHTNGYEELYDLIEDPSETRDLSAEQASPKEEGRKIIDRLVGQIEVPVAQAELLDEDVRKRLEALGYLR